MAAIKIVSGILAAVSAIPLRANATGLPPIAPAMVDEAAAPIPDHNVALTCFAKRHSHADGPIASIVIKNDAVSDITIQGQPFCSASATCRVSTEKQFGTLIVHGVGLNNVYREKIKVNFSTGELTAEGGGMDNGWSLTAICKVTGSRSTDH